MTKTEAQFTDDINEAIRNDDLERTTLLLDERASVFSTPPDVDFLTLACETGSASIVSLLLSRGTEIYTDALIAVCDLPEHRFDILQAFLDSGWNINTCLGYMGDLLALCLDLGPSMIKWAIEHDADPNLNISDGCVSALEVAVMDESLESVEILIDMGGAQINNTNALKFAARAGCTDIIELLLAKGAEIDEIPRPKYAHDLMDHETGMGTALHQAAVAGQLDAVQLLIAKGADPRLKNLAGKTALELAKGENHAIVVEFLESCN